MKDLQNISHLLYTAAFKVFLYFFLQFLIQGDRHGFM